ncbi:PLK protein kinase [Pseudogymnoascus sp. 05NY08]|nr:PLK protein kinase [Pseudogymnoascus sp. 05NY08]
MEGRSCMPPVGWLLYEDMRLPQRIMEHIIRKKCEVDQPYYSSGDSDSDVDFEPPRDPWYQEIGPVHDILYQDDGEEAHHIAGSIFCEALSIPRDCVRPLLEDESHQLVFFTNQRVIQIYCAHDSNEKQLLDNLACLDFEYHDREEEDQLEEDETYEATTKEAFATVKPYLAWESLYPEGIDMAALSPLDINANLRPRQAAHKERTKAPPAKVSPREKDHPPPPPAEVHEPPSSDRPNGATYATGTLLGKGGFAICHDGVLAGTREKYALKIVKSVMPQKKMEQKFQTELQIHSKMRHANIVQFHRAFTYQESTYIVLELCPNGSLMDMVKKRRFVTEPEVRFYTIQIAGAIKYMHSKGIIHRDLKMGNIFLDKDMNVKVGDFGLAALLMSGKDMTACRRTTLCGTPNYIAPEILEKGKGGHDHAVDIWSLGIIIFAMLTGRPPFQSTTQEEIYRKAREREYDWPSLDKTNNYISQEAKDLVALLLQSPEERPDCDTIVQHPFFSSGWVPQEEEMTPSLRENSPDPNQFATLSLRGGRASLYARNLKALCVKSEVGPWSTTQKVHSSTYREVAAEEKAGLTPAVPLADNVVYRPFDEVVREHKATLAREESRVATKAKEYDQKTLTHRPVTVAAASKTVPRSFAAQQRAQNQPPTISATARRPRAQAESGPSTRRANPYDQASEEEQASIETRTRSRREPSSSQAKGKGVSESVVATEARLGADMVQQLGKSRSESTAPAAKASSRDPAIASIFSPSENAEFLHRSKPRHVTKNLQVLYAEIERALNSRSVGPAREAPDSEPTIVVKWVDYTNKFGLGYILNDGGVGCIFKSLPVSGDPNAQVPPTCVVVRNAEKHLQNRRNPNYPDRNQLVPVSGADIEFFENNGDEGISCVKVNPRAFAASEEYGVAGKLGRGKDEWEDRKREKIVLWRKFANYMTVFGRDQDHPYDDALNRMSLDGDSDSSDPNKSNVVTFYQRFGDVGCWGFRNGSFQFNFPDHTKILLSADGTWCDFYHLPLEAARDLALTGNLPSAALDDRQHLSFPLQAFLNFMTKPSTRNGMTSRRRGIQVDPMIQGIPAANDFRRKVEFIKAIVGEWITKGGIGRSAMDPESRLRWLGNRELVNVKVPFKHVWVTVGAYGGDDRRVAWFDPREPSQVVPDIEA